MEQNLKDFANEYAFLMNANFEAKQAHQPLTYIQISTMTAISDMSGGVDICALRDNFTSPVHPVCTMKHTKAHNEYELTKRGKTKKSFYNQITIQFTDCTTKSIKVFSNGRLQMTGLTSYMEAVQVAQFVCRLLNDTKNVTSSTLEPRSVNIAMINTNFSFGVCMDILKIKELLRSRGLTVVYDPDVYPGLKVKIPVENGSASMFVFATGNVVITGVKQLSHVTAAYNHIADVVLPNVSTLRLNLPVARRSKTRSNNTEYKHGYPIQLLNCCATTLKV